MKKFFLFDLMKLCDLDQMASGRSEDGSSLKGGLENRKFL